MTNARLTQDPVQMWITVDGKPVDLFDVKHDHAKLETTCWIASEVDKTFAVCFVLTRKTRYDRDFCIFLDGQKAGRRAIRKETVQRPHQRSYLRVSPSQVRPYVFGALQLTDDDSLEAQCSRNIGEIKVSVSKGSAIRSLPRAGETHYAVPQVGVVNERSKKALEHQIKYGEARNQLAMNRYRFDSVKNSKKATFIFRYRPLAMLHANGIVPLNPSPPATRHVPESSQSSTSTRKRKAYELKQEGLDDEIGDREIQLVRELEKVRAEKRARREAAGSSQAVKQEPTRFFLPGEVIDLT